MKDIKLSQIIQGVKARDPKTLKSIYRDFYPKVLGYIVNRGGSGEDAKDIFQEVLMVVFKLSDSNTLDVQQDFGSYLIGIAKRLWFKSLRRMEIHERFVQQSEQEETEDHPSDVELENEMELFLIRKYILKLGEDCRNILMWSVEGISNDEIAERMNYKSEKIVRTKKYKCKTLLKNLIKQDPKFNR